MYFNVWDKSAMWCHVYYKYIIVSEECAVSALASTPQMKAQCSFERLIHWYQIAWHHIPYDADLHSHLQMELKSCKHKADYVGKWNLVSKKDKIQNSDGGQAIYQELHKIN